MIERLTDYEPKKKNGNLPETIKIDVVTIMPKGESEEGVLNPIPICIKGVKESVILYPSFLYYEEENGIPKSFSGHFKDSLAKKGK